MSPILSPPPTAVSSCATISPSIRFYVDVRLVCVSKRSQSLNPYPPPSDLSRHHCVLVLQWGSHGGMYLPDYYWDQINAVPVDYLCSQWFLRPEWLQYMWVSHYPTNTSYYRTAKRRCRVLLPE